jgi:hypothetical protein
MTVSVLPATVVLAPSYRLAAGLAIAALPVAYLNLWLGLGIFLFALFLSLQAAMLRLQFTDAALEIYRGAKLIRSFPYADWQTWYIFWRPIPILLFFREVNSIHFLPILFDPQTLRACLEQHIPLPESDPSSPV